MSLAICQVALLDHRSGARLGSCGWPHQLEFQWEPAFNIRLILCLAMSCSLFDAAFSKYGKNGKMTPFLCAVHCCAIMPKLVDQIPWFLRVPPLQIGNLQSPPAVVAEVAHATTSARGNVCQLAFRKYSGDFCQRSWRTWVMLLMLLVCISSIHESLKGAFCYFLTLVSNKDTFVMIV